MRSVRSDQHHWLYGRLVNCSFKVRTCLDAELITVIDKKVYATVLGLDAKDIPCWSIGDELSGTFPVNEARSAFGQHFVNHNLSLTICPKSIAARAAVAPKDNAILIIIGAQGGFNSELQIKGIWQSMLADAVGFSFLARDDHRESVWFKIDF